MDGLFGLIWMAFIVVTIVNAITGKNKKNQKKQTSIPPVTAKPVAAAPKAKTVRELEEMYQAEVAAAKAKQTEAVMPPQPVTPPASITPRVHTHLAPDCEMDEPSGSLDFISTEGMDPCHDDELPDRLTPRRSFPVIQEKPGLTLEWTSDALVKSVVMQEILTRPSQRRR